ncbi:right-handed parallel beta-helix repeat-containing protein [Hymenobacter weizhouensis]|uniref:right-handed parallel beta-helix repeat-containing protein n=1 Tax=Hymenobacter sp. YIM 151500-1 TaxID=2987689 RepID=UPI002227F08F|nr:right-handed parallel beta-helix repeat-containing protein [Hymenobacter sp. YIM 151500-1]UYZ62961.1 hypothetical protein OIS53_18450 [Hymenobacter sp. YIM 151500-1]
MKTILSLFCIFLLHLPVQAQTTRVVSNANDAGAGSLREALTSAANGDLITFAPGLAGQTIRLSSQLTLSKSVTIDGQAAPGLTLSGESRTRILRIDYSFVTVTIKHLTFADGRAVDADPNTAQRGGALELLDPNTLRLENCRFLRNVGERSGAVFVGYGARATVLNCVFDGNDGSVARDGFSAGAISTYGGGPAATVLENGVGGRAHLEVRGCTFVGNKGIVGGAIYVLLGGLTVEDCVFRQNDADQGGGAIFQDGADGTERENTVGGTTTIRGCQMEGNTARGVGGGLFLWGYSLDRFIIENTVLLNNSVARGGRDNESKGGALQVRDRGSLLLRNCTLAGNTVTQQGGGMWLDCRGPEGITIENCTFSGNRASTGPGGTGDIGGAAVFNTPASVRIGITNSTFVGNAADRADGNIWIAGSANAQNLTFTNCVFAGNRAGATSQREQTVNFPALSGGGNFVQSPSAGGAQSGIAGATYLADLRLNPALQTVPVAGRLVPVHPLLPTSPLVDAGVAVAGLSTDQLGTTRPQDGNQDGTARFDPGAVELAAQVPLPVVLTRFGAQAVAAGVQVSWETAQETNSATFVVERSADGTTFQTVGERPAAGTSTQPRSYSLLDTAPLPGQSYYRLRLVNTDGSQQFSAVVGVRRDITTAAATSSSAALSVFPNPVARQATVTYTLSRPGPVRLELYTPGGRRAAVLLLDKIQAAGSHTYVLTPATHRLLAGGVYYCTLHTPDGRYTQRLVLGR